MRENVNVLREAYALGGTTEAMGGVFHTMAHAPIASIADMIKHSGKLEGFPDYEVRDGTIVRNYLWGTFARSIKQKDVSGVLQRCIPHLMGRIQAYTTDLKRTASNIYGVVNEREEQMKRIMRNAQGDLREALNYGNEATKLKTHTGEAEDGITLLRNEPAETPEEQLEDRIAADDLERIHVVLPLTERTAQYKADANEGRYSVAVTRVRDASEQNGKMILLATGLQQLALDTELVGDCCELDLRALSVLHGVYGKMSALSPKVASVHDFGEGIRNGTKQIYDQMKTLPLPQTIVDSFTTAA